MSAVNYLTYDDRGLREVRCMKGCGAILSQRVETREHTIEGILIREKTIQQAHTRQYKVLLQDGSYQNVLVCSDCYLKCSEADFKDFEETSAWGWKEEIKHTRKIDDKEAEAEVEKMCKRKKIVRCIKGK